MSTTYQTRALFAVNQYKAAKANYDFVQMDEASDSFNDIILQVENRQQADELSNMMIALIDAGADEALAVFAREAEKISGLKTAFELQGNMSERAAQSLFFPSTAKELAKVSGTIQALKTSSDALLDSLESTTKAFSQKDAMSLISEAMRSKQQLDELLEGLRALQSALPENE